LAPPRSFRYAGWMRQRLVPAALVLFSFGACSPKSQVARVEAGFRSTAIDVPPALSKPAPVEAPTAKTPAWTPAHPSFVYPLPFDYGIRKDVGGSGYFLAPRKHGKHNGVDLLAPVGTPITAACSGKAKSAMRGGFGRTVQLVCKLPEELGGDQGLYVSLFFAHLERTPVHQSYEDVKSGATIGFVGKTGNAAGPEITPHLHLEAIVRGSLADALREHHSGVDPKAAKAADLFFEELEKACIGPSHLRSEGDIRRERRVDPFVLLTCAAKPKPPLTEPNDAELRMAALKWSTHYASSAFDVDAGPVDVRD
jgi:murein DD-endopeptidase MepM/ murein hydrolase activator NlpD